MRILTKKKQMEILKRLDTIRVIDDDNVNLACKNISGNKEAARIIDNIDYMADNVVSIAEAVAGIGGIEYMHSQLNASTKSKKGYFII